METSNLPQSVEQQEDIPYHEILTAGGCSRDSHRELTLGLGRFDSIKCPQCGLDVFRP